MNFEKFTGLAQALFEESTDSLLLLDSSAENILDANAASQRLCGLAARDLIAAPVLTVFQTNGTPGLRPLPAGARRVHRPFAQRRCQLRSVNPDVWLPVDITLTRLDVRTKSLTLLKVRDAWTYAFRGPTFAKRMRLLVHEVSACFWSAEIRNRDEVRFHYRSPVIERVTGRPASFFGSGLQRWHQIIHPDDRSQWQLEWKRLKAGNSSDTEYRIIWPDETVHWVRENVRVSARNSKRSICLYGIVSEITTTRQLPDSPTSISRQSDQLGHTV